MQRNLAKLRESETANGGVVMDGRDVGTVIFPDAELKIFVVADAAVRAMRRFEELKKTSSKIGAVLTQADYEQVLADLERRDKADYERAVSPLKKADGAVALDTTNLTIEEQVAVIVAIARIRMNAKSNN
ncbi:cytidylate kinase [Ramicandelaber brevisporus]|nr:cytidylate kinase [Ramicandelaber brevisporus]